MQPGETKIIVSGGTFPGTKYTSNGLPTDAGLGFVYSFQAGPGEVYKFTVTDNNSVDIVPTDANGTVISGNSHFNDYTRYNGLKSGNTFGPNAGIKFWHAVPTEYERQYYDQLNIRRVK